MINKTKIKIHPVYILFSIKKFLFLLIIPLIRGFAYYIVNSDLYSWFKGSWIDISVLMVIIGLAITRWYNYNIYLDKTDNQNHLTFVNGIFIQKKTIIPIEKVSFITTKILFYYRIINAINLEVNVCSQNKTFSKVNLILTKKNFNCVMTNCFNQFLIQQDDAKTQNTISLTTTMQTIFLSLIMSNSLAGIIFISTFISTTGKLLGYKLENELYGHLTTFARKLAFGVPPAGMIIAYVLIIGWLIAFFRNLISYLNFKFKKKQNYLKTSIGLLNIENKYINIKNINYVDIIQNLFTKIIGLASVFVDADYTKHKIVVVPTINVKKLQNHINKILNKNINNITHANIRPSKSSVFSYTASPMLSFLFIFFVFNILKNIYPNWIDFLVFILSMMSIICLWLFVIKVINFCSCGLSYQDSCYIIKHSRLFKIYTTIIPKSKVTKIKMKQNIFQKCFGKFDLIIYPCSSHLRIYKLKNLNICDLNKIPIR